MRVKKYLVESCVTSLIDALRAESNGADRLEICSCLETEGMTPDIELVKSLLEKIKIPVRVMFRETEIGFEADDIIINKMVDSILKLKELKIEGFVFGILKENKIDREAMSVLLKAVSPLPVTFHKAIDLSETKWGDIEWMDNLLQVDTILTSGGAEKAIDGIEEILKMKNIFRGEIMAAGKITADHVSSLHKQLQLKWYHGRNITG